MNSSFFCPPPPPHQLFVYRGGPGEQKCRNVAAFFQFTNHKGREISSHNESRARFASLIRNVVHCESIMLSRAAKISDKAREMRM
jgi:hypothetical protein